MKRRQFITLLCGVAAAWSLTAHAQQPKPLPKVGCLKIQGRQHTPDQLQAFREGMRALGLVEGRDYEIEERYADGDEARLPNLTTGLLKAGVSVILATSQPSIIAAARVTKTVPVIGRMVDDPVADGMAQSLARPAGNVTGIYTMTEELNPKRLSLLRRKPCHQCAALASCCDVISPMSRQRITIGGSRRQPRSSWGSN